MTAPLSSEYGREIEQSVDLSDRKTVAQIFNEVYPTINSVIRDAFVLEFVSAIGYSSRSVTAKNLVTALKTSLGQVILKNTQLLSETSVKQLVGGVSRIVDEVSELSSNKQEFVSAAKAILASI